MEGGPCGRFNASGTSPAHSALVFNAIACVKISEVARRSLTGTISFRAMARTEQRQSPVTSDDPCNRSSASSNQWRGVQTPPGSYSRMDVSRLKLASNTRRTFQCPTAV